MLKIEKKMFRRIYIKVLLVVIVGEGEIEAEKFLFMLYDFVIV